MEQEAYKTSLEHFVMQESKKRAQEKKIYEDMSKGYRSLLKKLPIVKLQKLKEQNWVVLDYNPKYKTKIYSDKQWLNIKWEKIDKNFQITYRYYALMEA